MRLRSPLEGVVLGGDAGDSRLLVGDGSLVEIAGGTWSRGCDDVEGQDHALVTFPDGVACPAFVDLHAHVGPGISKYGVERSDHPRALLSQGDAGPGNVEKFLPGLPPGAYLALSLARFGEQLPGPCYEPVGSLDPDGVVAAVEAQPDVIWGLSVNLDPAALGTTSADQVFDETMALAGALGLPVILGTGSVHSTDVIRHIEALRSGDVLTYLFRGGDASLFGNEETVEAMRRAQARGVVLDASHGAYSFDDRVARQAMASGVEPNSISSDTSAFTRRLGGRLQQRALVRAVAAGLGTERAILACTHTPGSVLGLEQDWLPGGRAGDFDVIRWRADASGAIVDLELLAVMRSGHLTTIEGSHPFVRHQP